MVRYRGRRKNVCALDTETVTGNAGIFGTLGRQQRVRARRALLQWYDRDRRDLPWRRPENAADPYRVWVSEIMLQQTRVSVVEAYYWRFVGRFPNVRALAEAAETDVLALWSGLGYYRRARQLRQAAQAICERHGGRFPESYADAIELPGVGRYTAGAVLSIAYGQRLAAVDGNVGRVVGRLAATVGDSSARYGLPAATVAAARNGAAGARTRSLGASAIERLVSAWQDPRRPGDFNQALMDLGATVCTPAIAHCEACPLQRWCLTAQRGTTPGAGAGNDNGWHGRVKTRAAAESSAPPARERMVALERRYALHRRGSRIWLVRRDAGATWMPGMMELPPFRGGGRQRLLVRHTITKHRITARVFEMDSRSAPACGRSPSPGSWLTLQEALAAPLTGLARKILRAAGPA
jgi:A/G-specific adenine glycosylase